VAAHPARRCADRGRHALGDLCARAEPGLILVDEEHDQSYKQEETPRYNARDVAVMRAKLEGAVVVLGSATPSLESWQNSAQGKYTRIEMRDRVMNRPLPEVELIDMRREFRRRAGAALFARAGRADAGGAGPRRAGADSAQPARLLVCRDLPRLRRKAGVPELRHLADAPQAGADKTDAGWRARAAAGVPLLRLSAHGAGALPQVRQRAPLLPGRGLAAGRGAAGEIFPGARIGRMDRDTVRGRYDLERLLARLHSGEINLLVGTQMIAKGHDIHGVTLVGVVGCDHALSMPDFRAAERVFQLMTQVSAAPAAASCRGRVVVQTYYPDHYAILAASKHDYASFVERELKYRRWMHYPPFGVLANVLVQSQKLEEAAGWSASWASGFKSRAGGRARAGAVHRAHRAHQGRLPLSHDF
jgi:primosomal protein N' (replication factor Y) (superfamily II helicase)